MSAHPHKHHEHHHADTGARLVWGLLLTPVFAVVEAISGFWSGSLPARLSAEGIGKALAAVPCVVPANDLHVWTLSSNRIALLAHLLVESFAQWTQVLNRRYSPCAGCIVMPQKMSGSR